MKTQKFKFQKNDLDLQIKGCNTHSIQFKRNRGYTEYLKHTVESVAAEDWKIDDGAVAGLVCVWKEKSEQFLSSFLTPC